MRKRPGTIAGIPYDPRRPTKARFVSTYWSAENPKFFPPKMVGIGWGINFYWVIHPLRWLKARKASPEAVEPESSTEESPTDAHVPVGN
jgi:hypothetical protein